MHPDLTILKEEINGGDIPEHDEYEGFYTCHKESYTEMVYKCSICTFTTTYKNIIKNHILLLHMKYAPTIQTEKMRKCSFPGCNFQTLHSIKKHEQIHSNVFHKCDKCSFQTKRKEYLSSHVTRVHGKSLGMEIFRCDDCSYEATMKENLIQHQEVHKKPEDRKVLKCPVAACSYEAICRRTLKRHSLQHKDPSQVEILKCTKCPYYAIEKNALWKHTKRMHGTNQSEREVFRCDKCQFQTYNKPSIRGHVLIHANRVEMFKCPHCSYETKRKYNLTQHLVKHKSSSEMETFKCAMCSFETKRKNCIRNHIVAHMKSKNRR